MSNEQELAAAIIRALDVPMAKNGHDDSNLLWARSCYMRGVLTELAETGRAIESTVSVLNEIPETYPVTYPVYMPGGPL